MGKTIVLAHGILGFGAIPGLSLFVNYFNGVAAHLRGQGHQVSAPSVDPLGSIIQRGQRLADAILRSPTAASGREGPPEKNVHVIAHSMGGLDARHAIVNVPKVAGRVVTLVTIGTPHRGSPVADALVSGLGPLVARIPPAIALQLGSRTAALRDLTTAVAHRFDDTTPNVRGVRYIEVAGDATRGHHTLSALAAAVFQRTGEINDGLVTRSSALRANSEQLADWPYDHFAEVGWPPTPLDPHLARYDAIVRML